MEYVPRTPCRERDVKQFLRPGCNPGLRATLFLSGGINMKRLVLSLTIAGSLVLTGCCSLVSLNPFVTDEQAVFDPALPGTWTSADSKEIYWIRQDGNGYTIRYVGDSSPVFELKARMMTAGEVKILDFSSASEDAFQMPVHGAARVWLEDNTLRLALLHTNWLKEQAGRQLPTVSASDRLVITAPGEAVRGFLAKAGADLEAADELGVLHRVQ